MEKKLFYNGVNHKEFTGREVTFIEFVGSNGITKWIQGDDAVTINFKVAGCDDLLISHYRWAFWEDTEEGRAAYERANALRKQASELMRQANELQATYTLYSKP